jgi:sugar phosphate isomerase/epimerase/signal transduction histidine kinase
MKLAFQTICWNHRVRRKDWARLFKSIKAAGFDGVEIFQPLDQLPHTWQELRQLAQAAGLVILGLTGDTLPNRMDYLRPDGKPGIHPEPYLYMETWDQDVVQAYTQRFTLALHYNHLSGLSGVEEALRLLDLWPNLMWLPDTAHLFIGQQSNDKLIELLLRLRERTLAVHLKDWKAAYGRFSHRYARGFCAIGSGQVDLKRAVHDLTRAGYHEWFVIELDSASSNPDKEMLASAKQLRTWPHPTGEKDQRILDREPMAVPSGVPEPASENLGSFRTDRLLHLASAGEPSFYQELAEFLRKELCATGCAVCLSSYAAARISIQASCQEQPLERDNHKQIERLAAMCVKSKVIAEDSKDTPNMLAVPVLNRYNPNQVRMVMVFDYSNKESEFIRSTVESKVFQGLVGDAEDMFVTERSLVASEAASRLASMYSKKEDFLNAIACLVKQQLDCEGVTIFLSTSARDALITGGTTGIAWEPGYERRAKQRYLFGEGLTGRAAKDRSYSIYRDIQEERNAKGLGDARSHETGVTKEIDSCLIAPFFNIKDEVAGVVRCRNKRRGEDVQVFDEKDLALVESIMQVAQPTLEVLAEERRLEDAVILLGHELSNPIFALRGALSDLELNVQRQRSLRSDTFQDLNSWLDLMAQQVKQYELFVGFNVSSWTAKREVVKFVGDILAPVVSQARMLIRERGFSSARINYGGLEDWLQLPFLYVDRNMFEQVAFNLISNAIKYAYPDPTRFDVRIYGERTQSGARIVFEDYGLGVPPGWEKDIFLQHARVETEDRIDTPGHGLGLWVVDRIVALHGGTIRLQSNENPTRFVIDLPASCLANSTKRPRS